MSRKPAVLTPAELHDAARAAVATAVAERLVVLDAQESRDTSGGAILTEPFVMGRIATDPPLVSL